jgi:AcrR family transcriptional regulator
MAGKQATLDVNDGADAASNGGRKSERTRLRILDAAAKVFRAQGYAGARLADIAAEAGTKAGSLYYYFESREALVEEVLDQGLDRAFAETRRQVDALPSGTPRVEQLATAIRAHMGTVLELDNYTSASIRMLGHVPEPIRARHMKRQAVYGAYWRELLEAAADAGELRDGIDLSAARMLLLGMLNWSPEWYRGGRLSPEEIAIQAAEMALGGLRKIG